MYFRNSLRPRWCFVVGEKILALSTPCRYLKMHYMLNLVVMSALLLVFEYCRCLRPRITCLQKEEDRHINPVFIAEYCWDHLLALTNNFTGTVTNTIIYYFTLFILGNETEVTGFFRNIELLYCACALIFLVPKVSFKVFKCTSKLKKIFFSICGIVQTGLWNLLRCEKRT